VWEQLPDPVQFLAHLKLKAGLPPNYWSDTLKVYRYTTESFSE
jgi:AMMECR1 domain-containing protein